MSKSLSERLDGAKRALGDVDAAIARSSGRLPTRLEAQFRAIAEASSDVNHWKYMLAARDVARSLMEQLEEQANEHEEVPYGASRAQFQIVRLLSVQSYLSAQWALADRLVAMAGQVYCMKSEFHDPKNAPQLVSHFVAKASEKKTSAIVYQLLRESFGWPIAVSYALRNHFLHDGGGGDFFDGPGPHAKFVVSRDGWDRIEQRARESGVDRENSRSPASWEGLSGADLRKILDACALDIDEALGVLIGSACQSAFVHVGFLLGEDR